MALFCVSLLRFPFHNHVKVISYRISPVCRLKYPYNCFSSHFYFRGFVAILFILLLSVILLAAVINSFDPFDRFSEFFDSSKCCIYAVLFFLFSLAYIGYIISRLLGFAYHPQFICSLVHLSEFLSCLFLRMVHSILQDGLHRRLFL